MYFFLAVLYNRLSKRKAISIFASMRAKSPQKKKKSFTLDIFFEKHENHKIVVQRNFKKKLFVRVYFKIGILLSKNICVICFIESPLQMMKSAFYFILKAYFVLKIFKFLS